MSVTWGIGTGEAPPRHGPAAHAQKWIRRVRPCPRCRGNSAAALPTAAWELSRISLVRPRLSGCSSDRGLRSDGALGERFTSSSAQVFDTALQLAAPPAPALWFQDGSNAGRRGLTHSG